MRLESAKRSAQRPKGPVAARCVDAPAPIARTTVPRGALADPRRFSRASWLAGVLVDRIIDGSYAPGERIREAALQQEFGFSNGPIREALQTLVADGLARRAPWQGVRVIELDEEHIVDLFELRAALLEHAAELAAQKVQPADVESAGVLHTTIARKFAAARADSQPRVTGETTDWVLSVARNACIAEVWRTTLLKSRIFVYRSMRRTAGAGIEPIIHELIDAIARRKPAAARRAARALTRQMLADLGLRPRH
jgi:DNA-binding GntR family transcriptional regulator